MAERCRVCGARWPAEGGALECLECGAPRRNTVPPVLGGDPTASASGLAPIEPGEMQAGASGLAPLPPMQAPAGGTVREAAPSPAAPPLAPLPVAGPSHLLPGHTQPLPSISGRRTRLLAAGGLGLAITLGTLAWLANGSLEPEPAPGSAPPGVTVVASDPSGCAQLEALTGSWVFATTTTGARRKQKLGTRGFYEVRIEVDGCSARASMAKTGRTAREAFDDHKIPRAEATLAPGEGLGAFGWAGTFVLRNEDGQGIDTQFVLAPDGERLVGSWRQLGERWASSGLYGVLEGRRVGDPTTITPSRRTQPCEVRCATPDDIAMIDAADPTSHAACLASCQ